jgi:periplasmic protein TonB
VREQRLLEGGDVAVEPRAELGHPRGRRDAFLDGLATGARRSRGADQVEAGRALAAPQSSSDDDQPPRPVRIVKPLYPRYAFDEKIEGTVQVQILIGASGKVTNACILQSVPYLNHAALEAVYQWRFSPAIKDGSPVATLARAPVKFRIY